MRELIDRGYLCKYVIYGPREAIDTRDIKITRSGDFSPDQLRDAAHKSSITGDIVQHYLKYAAGKNGVTFAVDVALAEEHAAAFRQAGVPAVVLHANSKDYERSKALRDFKAGIIKQIVNVDILGEGFDVPMIEVASFARPTQSYGLYVQQFGRALRPLADKPHGCIIDHVGNVARHGLPDTRTAWTLEGRTRAEASREMPIRTCPECFRIFESWGNACTICGFRPEPQQRDRPELVEGDLTEYTPELLAQIGKEAKKAVSVPRVPARSARDNVIHDRMIDRRDAQHRLREAIAYWAGFKRDRIGNSDSVSYREFYHKFGVDVATAQTLGAGEAEKLREQVERDLL
jgi:superfamily II DNA or RNA helicase